MKRWHIFAIVGAILFSYASTLYAPWVSGYYRKDGTYVPGYWRSSPNEYKWDNKSFDKWDSPYLTDRYNQSWFSSKKSYRQTKRMEDYQKQSEPVRVRGYYRWDRTYVEPHKRRRPPKQNNWWEAPSYSDDDYDLDDYDLDLYDLDE